MTFTERIQRRLRLWWGHPRQRGDWRVTHYTPHQLRERYSRRRREDPEEAWRCCAYWPRTLVNKWNSREFVVKHGCPVPALYWCARMPSAAQVRSLPPQFVLRPVLGTGDQGVFVVADGRNLLTNEPFVIAALRRSIMQRGRLAWTVPLLAEEFVGRANGGGQLPREYKFHTFGACVAAVQAVDRSRIRSRQRYYSPDWREFSDPLNTYLPRAEPFDRPPCLDQMLRIAVQLGAAIGTYMRIDFFASEERYVFNEFASTPFNGMGFTPTCDAFFGSIWEDRFPHAS